MFWQSSLVEEAVSRSVRDKQNTWVISGRKHDVSHVLNNRAGIPFVVLKVVHFPSR